VHQVTLFLHSLHREAAEFAALLSLFCITISYFFGLFKLVPHPSSPIRKKECFQVFCLFLAIQFILLPSAIHFGLFWMSPSSLSTVEIQGWSNIFALCIIFCALAAFCYYKWEVVKMLFQSKNPLHDVFIGCSVWLVAYPIIVCLSQLMTLIFTDYWGFSLTDQLAVRQIKAIVDYPTLFTATAIMVIFVVPILEELLFRGFLYTALRRSFSSLSATVMSSFVFAFFHYSFSQGINNINILSSLFVLALFLGLLRERQGNLLGSIALHSAFNAISISMMVAWN
jgi:uncharacterized protein